MRFGLSIVIIGLLLLQLGCQSPVNGQRQPIFDLSRAPRLFNFNRSAANNNSNNNLWAQNPNLGADGLAQYNSGVGPDSNSLVADQFQKLRQKFSQIDNDNHQLVTDLASYKQKLQAANDYNLQLKQQLTDSIGQIKQLQLDRSNLQQQLATVEMRGAPNGMLASSPNSGPPTQLATAPSMRANNSLMDKLSLIQLPGLTSRMDGDVIRVEIPSDQLFTPSSFELSPAYTQTLQQLAAIISRNFPEQIIGIEGHWDNSPLPGTFATAHQLTATECLAVFQQLVRIGIPERQLFTMGMGSNRPRYQNQPNQGLNSNRRIEIVIYPESYTGR